jgi:hypothetical protein
VRAGALQLFCALALAGTVLQLAGCAEPQWARQTWPSPSRGQLAQPEARAAQLSLQLSARAITWEPEAIVVELVLVHEHERALILEPRHVFLAYDGLEYAPELAESIPTSIELAHGEEQTLELRYTLGRALTGLGARLLVRGLRSGEESIDELPELDVPAMPARARPNR